MVSCVDFKNQLKHMHARAGTARTLLNRVSPRVIAPGTTHGSTRYNPSHVRAQRYPMSKFVHAVVTPRFISKGRPAVTTGAVSSPPPRDAAPYSFADQPMHSAKCPTPPRVDWARLAWLEAHAEQTPETGTSAPSGDVNDDDDSGSQENNEPRVKAGDTGAGGATSPGEGAPGSDSGGDAWERAAGDSPAVAWATPEEGGEGVAGRHGSEGSSGAIADGEDGEIERLWCRMGEIESRIYRTLNDGRRLQSQVRLYASSGWTIFHALFVVDVRVIRHDVWSMRRLPKLSLCCSGTPFDRFLFRTGRTTPPPCKQTYIPVRRICQTTPAIAAIPQKTKSSLSPPT